MRPYLSFVLFNCSKFLETHVSLLSTSIPEVALPYNFLQKYNPTHTQCCISITLEWRLDIWNCRNTILIGRPSCNAFLGCIKQFNKKVQQWETFQGIDVLSAWIYNSIKSNFILKLYKISIKLTYNEENLHQQCCVIPKLGVLNVWHQSTCHLFPSHWEVQGLSLDQKDWLHPSFWAIHWR